jgi:hypothetical protein
VNRGDRLEWFALHARRRSTGRYARAAGVAGAAGRSADDPRAGAFGHEVAFRPARDGVARACGR